jgi:hypothetical protein
MNKRPPQRQVPRPEPAADPRIAFASSGAVVPGSPDATPASSAGDRELPAVSSRADLVDLLQELRSHGALDVGDEAALLRQYDGLLAELRSEKSRLEVEFRERLARDGEDDTNAWLASAAEALGRRQGETLRQLLRTIPALSAPLGTG